MHSACSSPMLELLTIVLSTLPLAPREERGAIAGHTSVSDCTSCAEARIKSSRRASALLESDSVL